MKLTIGITTRDRPDAVRAAVESIAHCLPQAEVLVFDDGSTRGAAGVLADRSATVNLRVIQRDDSPGYIVGRNTIVREAAHEFVLLLDDDTVIMESGAIEDAVLVLERDASVAAVAFAQAHADGSPWPEAMQPARASAPACITAFIGFAHLLRRSTFQQLGGYRDEFVHSGEEKDYCLRLLAAGHRVVYLPGARVAHLADQRGRDRRRYVRYVIRNDCLYSLFNEPWFLVVAGLPVRLWRFWRMSGGGDPQGFLWVLRQLLTSLPLVRRRRRPVRWATMRAWRRLRDAPVPYLAASLHAECPARRP